MATLPALPNVKDFSSLEPRQEIIGYSPEGDPAYKQIPMDLGLAQYGVYNNVPKEAFDKLKGTKPTRDFSDPDNPSWVGPSVKVNGITYQGTYNWNTGELEGFTSNARFDADGGMVLGRYSVDGTARPYFSSSGSFLQNISPLLTAATPFIAQGLGSVISNQLGVSSTLGNVLANTAIQTTAAGGDLQKGLTNAIKSSAVSSIINNPETVNLNTQTADLQDVYGGNLPIEDIASAFEPVVPEGVTVGAAIPTPEIVATPLPAIESSVVQPDYFSVDAGPLADTTQDLESIIPPENPFLAGMEETTAIEGAGVAGADNPTGTYTGGANYLSGMEETTATEGAGVAGADNPTGTTVTVPDTVQEATKNLTPKQAYQLFRLGAGLFGGAGALTAAAKGLMGGGTGGGMAMPSIQAPTPFTGTYSGMNPYDADYFQKVQQNYNRLFPTTTANVAGPLESWYQTKYVPDTTISNKLFGV